MPNAASFFQFQSLIHIEGTTLFEYTRCFVNSETFKLKTSHQPGQRSQPYPQSFKRQLRVIYTCTLTLKYVIFILYQQLALRNHLIIRTILTGQFTSLTTSSTCSLTKGGSVQFKATHYLGSCSSDYTYVSRDHICLFLWIFTTHSVGKFAIHHKKGKNPEHQNTN